MLADVQKTPKATMEEVKAVRRSYHLPMMDDGTLANLKKHFPEYANQGYEIAGFVWFQGWNDMISADATAEYTVNLKHFINDVREDLKAPWLPFVIGEMGVDGVKPGANVVRFKDAQAAVIKEAAFKGNVALVKTDVFWDVEAEAVFRRAGENIDEWNKVGSDFPYHYLGSPKTMLRIGRAFGEAMIELRKQPQMNTDEIQPELSAFSKCHWRS